MMYTLIKTIREAGKIANENFGKKHTAREKGKKEFVTEVDFLIEKKIIAEIKKKYPRHNIIAEESHEENNQSDYTWYIDPLDGTHNYMYGIPLYGISIGLFYRNQPKAGAIYLPHFRELYYAEKGKGAFMNGERIYVSKRDISKAMVLATSQISVKKNEKISSLSKIGEKVFDYRAFGCATYALMTLASGKTDAYIMYNIKQWDVAAGFLILEEAGGKITDFNGNKWSISMHDLLATNGKIHQDVLKLVRK